MDDRPRHLLVQLIQAYGPVLATDPKRCRSLLSDHPQEISRRECMALIWALEHGLYQALMDGVQQQPVGLLLPRLTQNLLAQAPMEERAAWWAVESWAVALGLLPAPLAAAPVQSGVRPAPVPARRPATAAPPPGQVELVVALRDLTLTLRTGDTVRRGRDTPTHPGLAPRWASGGARGRAGQRARRTLDVCRWHGAARPAEQ